MKRRSTKLASFFGKYWYLFAVLAITTFSAFIFFRKVEEKPPKIKASSSPQFVFEAKNKTYSVQIGASKSPNPYFSFSSKTGSAISFQMDDTSNTAVEQKDNKVSFKNLNDSFDVTYTPLANGLKEEIVLSKPSDRSEFYFDIQTSNVSPRKTLEGKYSRFFYNDSGIYQFHLEKPFAIDASGVRTDDIQMQIRESGTDPNRYQIMLQSDPAWLSSADRTYPIVIDPTIVIDTSAEFVLGSHRRTIDTGSGSSPVISNYYQNHPVDQHTVALWRMDEASGNLIDASGNGFTALINGTTVAAGILGNSRVFNGTTDYINAGNYTKLPRAGDLTLETWFKTTDSGNTRIFLSHGDTSDWLYALSKNTANGLTCKLYQSASGAAYQEIVSSVVVNDGNWHHVGCVVQGTWMTLYLDGKVIGNTNTVTGTRDIATAGNLSIGRFNYSTTYNFVGSLDDIRISSVARSAEEIKASASRRPYGIYTSEVLDLGGVGGTVTVFSDLIWSELGITTEDGETLNNSTSLIAQWDFNNTSGTTATSNAGSCGASCNGTLTNFASTGSQDAAAGTGWTAANKRWGAGALMFDGTNDRVCTDATSDGSCDDVNSLDVGTGSFSVESWIKTSYSQWQYIFTKGTGAPDGTGTGYGVAIDSGKMYTFIHDGTRLVTTAAGTNIDNGMWHHLVWTFDRASNVTYYLDGKKIYVESISARSGSLDNSQAGYLGYFISGTRHFTGTIDSTRVYKRVLTSSEILSNYQAGQLDIQTRVGDTTNPDDGTWSAWAPITSEASIEGFENNEENTRVYEMSFSSPGVNQTWTKKNNAIPANSNTTSTDGRIGLGLNGTGDDLHIISSSVLKDGSTYKAWYMGSDGTNWRIYYATSSDGLTWTKYNNTVPSNSDTSSTDGRVPLGANGTGDDFHAGYPNVIKDGSTYKMWYSGNDGTIWRIYYATSSDGLTWTKYNNSIESASNTTGTQGRIPLGASGGDNSAVFMPTVIKDGSTYKMWYAGSDATNYRIFYATSSDGLTWTKYDNSIPTASDSISTNGRIPLGVNGAADDAYVYTPSVIKENSIYKMWFNMHDGTNVQIGYASSRDGLTWNKYHNAVPSSSNIASTNGRIPRGSTGGDTTHAVSANVIRDNGVYKTWYSGNDGTNYRIYYATMAPIPLSQSTESFIKQESTYSEKFVTTPLVDSAMVGLWHMDETGGSGAYIKDSSTNANHGTPTGTTLKDGVSGKARMFDGANDYIDLGTPTTFDFGTNGAFTHSGWIQVETPKNYAGFVSKVVAGRGGTYSYMTVVMLDGSLAAYTGAAWVTVCAAGSVIPNRWQHIAFSYNGAAISGYVNGISCGSIAFTYTDNTAHNLYIGSWYSVNTQYDFNGQIDEVVTSKNARPAEEIAEEYRLGRDHYINKTISTTDLSDKNSLMFSIAADRPGTYLQAMVGESAYANYQPDSNTVGLWHLDEMIAPAKDAAGIKNASIVGTASVPGNIGRGRSFNGTSDYIAIADSPVLSPTSQITTEAWIRTVGTGSNLGILGKTTGCASTGYLLWLNANAVGAGLPGFYIGAGAWLNGTTAVNDGKWHHIAGTFDGTTARLYIDGALNASGARSGSLVSTTQLQIGGQTTGAGCAGAFWFPGTIDEVRISNTARSADDIRQTFESGLRTHKITVDFASSISHTNPLSSASDLTFTLMATPSGTVNAGDNIFSGDKIIIRENYNGTEYLAQGTVNTVNISTGETTVTAWDGASTFPPNGFGPNSTVFKWQQEYMKVDGGVLDSSLNAVTNISLRLTDGLAGRTIYIDDLKSSGGYLTEPLGSAIASPLGKRYFQYRSILQSSDSDVSPSINSVSVDYSSLLPPAPTILPATTLSSTSIQWNFTDNANNETGFALHQDNGTQIFSEGFANLSSLTETGLTPNTQYTRRVASFNDYGSSAVSSSASKYTLAATPSLSSVTRNATTAQFSITANNNPQETLYAVYKETGATCDGSGGSFLATNGSDNGSVAIWATLSNWGATGTVTASGLNEELVYAFCAKAKNGEDVETAYSAVSTTIGNIVPISGNLVLNSGNETESNFVTRYRDGNDPNRYVIGLDNVGANNINSSELTLEQGSVTINSNETLVAGKINLTGGSMFIAQDGGRVAPGAKLWAVDRDADGYSDMTNGEIKVWYGDNAPTYGRRKALLTTLRTADCNDNSYSTTNTCCEDYTYYLDADGDSYGSSTTNVVCQETPSVPNGYVTNNTDCNDNNANRWQLLPGYVDSDSDNYGTGSVQSVCSGSTLLSSHSANNTDCNDGSNQVWLAHAQCYTDADGDTYTNGLASNTTCLNTASCATATRASASTDGASVTTYTAGRLRNAATTADCYDSNANAYPGSSTCSSTNRGDGSYDYNCSSTSTKCGTNYTMVSSTLNYYPTCYAYNCGSQPMTVYVDATVNCGQTGYAGCANGGNYKYSCSTYEVDNGDGGTDTKCQNSAQQYYCTSPSSGGVQTCQ